MFAFLVIECSASPLIISGQAFNSRQSWSSWTSFYISDCYFYGCRTTYNGGAVCIEASSSIAEFRSNLVESCMTSSGSGGGFYCIAKQIATITTCARRCACSVTGVCFEMTAGPGYMNDSNETTIFECQKDRTSPCGNCAYHNSYGAMRIRNLNESSNIANFFASGLHLLSLDTLRMIDCTFFNLSDNSVNVIMNFDRCGGTLVHCNFVEPLARTKHVVSSTNASRMENCVFVLGSSIDLGQATIEFFNCSGYIRRYNGPASGCLIAPSPAGLVTLEQCHINTAWCYGHRSPSQSPFATPTASKSPVATAGQSPPRTATPTVSSSPAASQTPAPSESQAMQDTNGDQKALINQNGNDSDSIPYGYVAAIALLMAVGIAIVVSDVVRRFRTNEVVDDDQQNADDTN